MKSLLSSPPPDAVAWVGVALGAEPVVVVSRTWFDARAQVLAFLRADPADVVVLSSGVRAPDHAPIPLGKLQADEFFAGSP